MSDRDIQPLIDRALPQREVPVTAAEREEWGQEEPPKRATIPLGLCNGVGLAFVWNPTFGEWCCPRCGGPESVGCWSEGSPSYNAYHRVLEGEVVK